MHIICRACQLGTIWMAKGVHMAALHRQVQRALRRGSHTTPGQTSRHSFYLQTAWPEPYNQALSDPLKRSWPSSIRPVVDRCAAWPTS